MKKNIHIHHKHVDPFMSVVVLGLLVIVAAFVAYYLLQTSDTGTVSADSTSIESSY